MKLRLALILFLPLFFSACSKDLPAEFTSGEGFVRLVDFDTSCNENLEFLDGREEWDFHRNYQSPYLHSDIDAYPIFDQLEIGDTLEIEYEVLEENPYPQRFVLCNRMGGVPVKILRIK